MNSPTLPVIVSVLLATSGALAAEPKAIDKPAVAASAPAPAKSKAQPEIRRKPNAGVAGVTGGPPTQTEDDVYVGVRKK